MRRQVIKKVVVAFVAFCAAAGIVPRGECFAQEASFRDNFTSNSLDSAWVIIREDPLFHSLDANPGFFRILTQRGLLGDQGAAKNLLMRAASGNFVIETRLEFDPRAGQQFAGIMVYEDDAHAVGVGLIRVSGIRGTFRGAIIVNEGGVDAANTRPAAARYDETNVDEPTVIYLRVLRQGNQFVAGFSEDGVLYRDLGTVSNEMPDTVLVGVAAANGDGPNCGSECDFAIAADFDFFGIRPINSSPDEEPVVGATLDRVEIVGPSAVLVGGSVQFEASAVFSDGSNQVVTNDAVWSIAPEGRGSIEGGLLLAPQLAEVAQATVVAMYTQRTSGSTVTKYGAKVIRLETDPSAVGSISLCGSGLATVFPIMLMSLLFARLGTSHATGNPRRRPSRDR